MLKSLPTLTLDTLPTQMVPIQGGTFMLGSEVEVTLSDFALCRFPVTQQLYEEVIGENPSYFLGSQRPVEKVSWTDCQAFIQALNQRTTGGYRLPTEAEWEYAARGGNYGNGSEYAGSQQLEEVGWYRENSGGETHPVGQLRPNELGLFDMSGNIWEWCQDWHDKDYYASSPDRDPKGPSDGAVRVSRGGSWGFVAGGCRVAYRYSRRPGRRVSDLGFRLARTP